ncbi:MAG: ATP-binding protein [Sedimentisphaerales bacterium]|nr:ATP-binding protein [Sedimentisphaerales bacterium]
MSVHSLKPWTELVRLHPDVESGTLAEAVFAIDLGAIATGDQATPKVYRDPDAFYAATYVTTDLRRLLEEVLASLAGKGSYDRVLKLRSPFGGGKSHTLAALLHAARSRKSLNQIPACKGLADPGEVRVAVFDGEKFTAAGGKEVDRGKTVNTMWGWLAWQIGPKAFEVFEKHDRERICPQGDEIRAMIAAEGRPVLFLLDEVLKYMESAGSVILGDSTLQRLALNFLQNLTVEVANSKTAVMVYSLQWSARQALGNIALLQTLDTLVSRVDQVREPVTGDEVLAVVKRRLLAEDPPSDAGQEVSKEYTKAVGGFLRARAETESARQDAESQAIEMRSRLEAAYPFHPSLIDVMNTRWTSIDAYQRTRGALRFLAACLHALKAGGGAKAMLGPGDINLSDGDVRNAMLKDLDPTQAYDPVIKSDITGANARAKRIDDRWAKETPAMANVRPAQRLATAILAFSFGGLKRGEGSEVLPPGVTETELLTACLGPDLDSLTANSVLSDLRNSCLYLHFDGLRYCFKKDPNVTKLIEDAEQEVARDPDSIRDRIREMLEARLAGRNEAVVWPATSQDLPDKEPRFLVGYMPLEIAGRNGGQQDDAAKAMLSKYGDAPRRYRNGVALAVPDKKPLESLRRAVRYLMAIDRVELKKTQYRLTKDQADQLKERKRTEEAAAETAFRQLYPAVWLPRAGTGGLLDLEKIEVGGRPLQATGVHERVMELLTVVGTKKVHTTLKAPKVVERVKLGEAANPGEPVRLGVRLSDVLDSFYEVLEKPRIISADVLRRAIAEGVGDSTFAYTTGTPTLGADGKYQVALAKVALGRTMSEDEVDLDSGFLMVPAAVPSPAEPATATGGAAVTTTTPATTGAATASTTDGQQPTGGGGGGATVRTAVRVRFAANRDQVFKSFPAIANLADKSDGGKINISVEGQASAGYDPNWLRNAVEEPLDEANIEGMQME